MEKIHVLVSERSAQLTPQGKTQAGKLAKKLDSFWHCPVTDKEYGRMAPFAGQQELVELVLEILRDYPVPDSGDYSVIFDTVGYWYCIALLSLSEYDAGLQFLDRLTDSLIARRHRDTSLLKRNFETFGERPTLDRMGQKIKQYFQELNETSPVYELLDSIGMTVPREAPWRFKFTLTNYDDFKFEKDMTEEEKEQRFGLHFEFHAPYGDGECYRLDLKNVTKRIHTGYITNLDPDGKIYFPRGGVELPSAPSVMKIKETIREIESACGIRLNRKFKYFEFPKEIKSKKILESWLEK